MHPLLLGTLAANWGITLFNIYINVRQWKIVYQTSQEPAELSNNASTSDLYNKMRKSNLRHNESRIFFGIYKLFSITTSLCYYYPSNMWTWVTDRIQRKLWQPVMYVVYETIINEIVRFPLSLIIFWGISQTLSTNKPVSLFLVLFLGQALFKTAFVGMATYYTTLSLDLFGRNIFMWSWLIWLISAVVITPIYIEIVLPFMGDYANLQSGRLKEKLERLSTQVNFPVSRIYVTTESHAGEDNVAYFAGMFSSKAIVISAFLALYMSDDEIVAVVAHEIGHWKLGHSLYYLITRAVYYFCISCFLRFFYDNVQVYEAFKIRSDEEGPHPAISFLLIASYMLPPIESFLRIFCNGITHKCELDADQFAKQLGQDVYLKSALIKMYERKKIFPIADRLYSMYYLTHPSILERVRAL